MKTDMKPPGALKAKKPPVQRVQHLPPFGANMILANMNKEDPLLKEKLKQIVEATQKSVDEAYLALHDCDYDINRAVNKLLEEGTNEWKILSKKKKQPKESAPAEKQEARPQQEKPAQEPPVAQENVEDTNPNEEKPMGRGRYNARGRGRQQNTRARSRVRQEMQERTGVSPMRRVFVNSNFEAMNRELLEASRQTDAAAKVRTPVIRPVDTWDPKRPVASLLTRGSFKFEFDDEEYTGSLSKGLVITSSNLRRRPQLDEGESDRSRSKSPISAVESRTHAAPPKAAHVDKPPDDTSSDKSPTERLEKTPSEDKENVPKLNLPRAPPMTASLVKAPPLSEKPPLYRPRSPSRPRSTSRPRSLSRPRSTSIPSSTKSTTSSSKIPSAPVEMPPDNEGSVELLDITFGAVDLTEEHPFENLNKSDSSSEFLLGSNKPVVEETKVPKKDKSLENLRFTKDLKISDGLYESTSSRRESFAKVAQKGKGYGGPGLSPETSLSSGAYTGLSSASSAFPTLAPYPGAAPPSSQSVPYYQAVLGGQTFTSSTHYGTSGLSSPSFSLPFQSYSSMLQTGPKSPAYEMEGSAGGYPVVSGTSASYPVVSGSGGFGADQQGKDGSQTAGKELRQQPMVGHHQLILGQPGLTYFQPQLYFQDVQQMMQQHPSGPGPATSPFYDFGQGAGGGGGGGEHQPPVSATSQYPDHSQPPPQGQPTGYPTMEHARSQPPAYQLPHPHLFYHHPPPPVSAPPPHHHHQQSRQNYN